MFEGGTEFVRADFHLHTRMDRTFSYSGDPNFFVSDYIKALEEAKITVGVITNHNLFDHDEFVQLRKYAAKRDILLLPGVELSVKDGANGIHMLVVFSEDWIDGGRDLINNALTSLFSGKTREEIAKEGVRTDGDLIAVEKELNKSGKDYFWVAAHVADRCGLWEELKGGRLAELANDQKYAAVRNRLLAFQKVHADVEREKARIHLSSWYPAEVEGSDPKELDQVGKGAPGYLKIGALNFDAVQFALRTPSLRVARDFSVARHSRIDSISYVGGIMDGTTIQLSSGLNALIGIRGSGKSAILETLRYALEMSPTAEETFYKNKLVDHVLSGGGKVIVRATSRYGQQYRIERINGNSHSSVYIDDKLQPGISIGETVITHPVYFGQKDLAGQGLKLSQDMLIARLLGGQLDEYERKIKAKSEVVESAVAQLRSSDNDAAQLEDAERRKQDIEYRLEVFKQAKIEDKLNDQIRFDADRSLVEKFTRHLQDFSAQVGTVLDEYSDIVSGGAKPTFDSLADIAGEYAGLQQDAQKHLTDLNTSADAIRKDAERAMAVLGKLDAYRASRADAVAATMRDIEREIGDSTNGVPLRPDEFLKLKKQLTQVNQAIELLGKRKAHGQSKREDLLRALDELSNARHDAFRAKTQLLEKMTSEKVNIEVRYRGDKKAFHDKLKDVVHGLKIRETVLESVVAKYPDFVDLYRDFDNAVSMFGASKQTVADAISEHLAELLTFTVPDKTEVYYHNHPSTELSIGQRASALMLFILAQCDHDLVIIDQPEDDLDNQTIYKDMITTLLGRKKDVQFIFATHNPNIPVLGDAEQIAVCRTKGRQESVLTGSLDNSDVRNGIIGIMEGGREAFDRRKEIYGQWN